METERRRVHRTRPEQLSYVQFEPDGGGIVLNASEQGLAFQTASLVRQRGPLQLYISPNPGQRIALVAQIAWMDKGGKSGGLALGELSQDARHQIRRWLAPSPNPVSTLEPSPPIWPEPSGMPSVAPGRSRALLPSVPTSPAPVRADAAKRSVPRLFDGMATTLQPEPFLAKAPTVSRSSRLLGSAIAGFLVLVFLWACALFLPNVRPKIGDSLIRLGEKLRGEKGIEPNASSPIAVPGPKANPETSAKETLTNPGASARETLAGSPDSGDGHSQRYRRQLPDQAQKKGRSELARRLWFAMSAGDRSAEFPLAQLYLKGDGVAKNCDQARVLLRAAARNGNTEASKELQTLNRNGCR
jgi:hypothetical protein